MIKIWNCIIVISVLLTSCSESVIDSKEGDNGNNRMSEKQEELNRAVVFYNVENLFDIYDNPLRDDDDFTPRGYKKWTKERYETKLDRIIEAFELLPTTPAIIGLVEVENKDVLNDLIDEPYFNEMEMGVVHHDSPDRRGIDCALLYDKSVFQVLEEEKIEVTMKEDREYRTRDILHVNGMLNGSETHVFVNHWSSRREGILETEPRRMQAASILRKSIDAILDEDENANIVVLGDFNDHPDDKSLEYILQAKESGYAEGRELINLLYDEHENGDGTIVHQGDWMVFDQVIISQSIYDGSNGIAIKENDAFILDDKKLIFTARNGYQKPNATYGGPKYYGGYSDHLPVYIIVK